MFRTNNEYRGVRFFSEALPLIASYFSGEDVFISPISTDFDRSSSDEYSRFAGELRLRHGLACSAELLPIIQQIESSTSSARELVRTESKGEILGALDISKHIARRSANLSWPKSYPIIISEETPNTPENALARRLMMDVLKRLTSNMGPSSSAESRLAVRHSKWLLSRLRREPWREVRLSGSIQRFALETRRRLQKRQTGHDLNYRRLIECFERWTIDPANMGRAAQNELAQALLTFPTDESFLDRIFEIWSLREVANSLIRLGAILVEGPQSLFNSRRFPIYVYELRGHRIEIWFQRALDPMKARWSYTATAQPFRGIPDITLMVDSKYAFIVDAKNRLVSGNTRSEETYKMFGYFENYRNLFDPVGCWGLLGFVTSSTFVQHLSSENGGQLFLIGAHVTDERLCEFSGCLDRALSDWLSSCRC